MLHFLPIDSDEGTILRIMATKVLSANILHDLCPLLLNHTGEKIFFRVDSACCNLYLTFVTSRNFSKAFLSPCNIGMIFLSVYVASGAP
jgi:hypothetical protein